jgi:hypothetical protein
MRVGEILVVGASLLGAVPSATGSERQDLRKLLPDAPADVARLAQRAIECRTWSTADVTDEASDARVESALAALRCGTLEADVDVVRRRHAESGSELRAIDAVRELGP